MSRFRLSLHETSDRSDAESGERRFDREHGVGWRHRRDPRTWRVHRSQTCRYRADRIAAVDYGQQGIRVNAVLPGAIRTPMLMSVIENERSEEHTSELQSLMRHSYA